MASIDDMKGALERADAAGDTEAVDILAKQIISLQSMGGSKPKAAGLLPGKVSIGPFDLKPDSIPAGLVMGAGRSIDRLIAGGKQMYNAATGNEKAADDLAQEQAGIKKAYGAFQKASPGSTAFGEAFPSIAGGMMVGNPAGIVGAALTAGAVSGIPELLSYGSMEERLKNGGKAAVLGAGTAGVIAGIGKAITPIPTAGRVSDDVMAAADRLGVKLTAGDETKNRALQGFEDYLSKSPGSSGILQKIRADNVTAVNRAAAKAIGENADDVSAKVLNAADNRIGSEFNRLRPQMGIDFNKSPEFMNGLIKADRVQNVLGPAKIPALETEIMQGLDQISRGQISGEAAQMLYTKLGGAAKTAFQNNDATLGRAITGIQEGLDEASKAALSGSDKVALELARKQWAALKVLLKGQVAEAGDVSAARMAGALRNQSGPQFRLGRMNSDLNDIGLLGEGVKAFGNPNSATGAMTQATLSAPYFGLLAAIPNRGLAGLTTSGIGRGYLTNGLLGDTSQEWLRRAAVQGGIGASEYGKDR